MHGQSPASPEGGRYLSRVGGGVVALGQTGERHPWISFFSAILPVRPTTDYLPYALVTVSLLCSDAIWMAVRPGGSVVTETTAMAPRET